MRLRADRLAGRLLDSRIPRQSALNFADSHPPLRKVHALGVRLAFDASETATRADPLTAVRSADQDRPQLSETESPTSVEDAAIVRSMIATAHNPRAARRAEGVETRRSGVPANGASEEAQAI